MGSNSSTCTVLAWSVEGRRRRPCPDQAWLEESGESTTEFAGIAGGTHPSWDACLDACWLVLNSLALLHANLAPADFPPLGLNFFQGVR